LSSSFSHTLSSNVGAAISDSALSASRIFKATIFDDKKRVVQRVKKVTIARVLDENILFDVVYNRHADIFANDLIVASSSGISSDDLRVLRGEVAVADAVSTVVVHFEGDILNFGSKHLFYRFRGGYGRAQIRALNVRVFLDGGVIAAF
jgi:hypothetical protein